MRVLVIGGTRGLGRAVVVAAHAAGHTLTVMARNAAAFAEPVSGLRMVVGDASDADDVARATADQDAVAWTVGSAGTRREVHVFSRGTQHLLAAMQRHGVRRLVCVTGSAVSAHPDGRALLSSRIRPLLSKAVVADKARQEALIRDSAIDWILVRPAALSRTKPTGLYQTLTTPPEGRVKRISRADVAEFIVENLEAPEYVRRTVMLTG
jgi:putative NADH-flavin reductase